MSVKYNRLEQLLQKSLKGMESVIISDNGKVKNWKYLRPVTKEAYLEDTYDNLDYSHSHYLYPACRLLQELGWKHLAELNEITGRDEYH